LLASSYGLGTEKNSELMVIISFLLQKKRRATKR